MQTCGSAPSHCCLRNSRETVPGPGFVGKSPREVPGVGFLQEIKGGEEFVVGRSGHQRSTTLRLTVFSGSASQARTAGVISDQGAPSSVAASRRNSWTSGCWRSRPSS